MSLVIAGAGGVGREALDVALALDREVSCFVDERTAGSTVRGLPVAALDDVAAGDDYLVGIADPYARRRLAEALEATGLAATSLVHPAAVVGPETTIEPGALVMALAAVSSSVVIGPHAQVHYGTTVGHDARLDAFPAVFPGANVGGAVHLEEGATVGSGAVVLQGRTIGASAFVGAGAVVTRDVAPGAVVVGVPARTVRRS